MVRKEADAGRLGHAWEGRPDLAVVLGDVTDRASLDRVMEGCDVVVHAAAVVGDGRGVAPSTFHQTNVEGTANVWRAAGQAGVGQAILVSTVAVYGRPRVPEVSEEGVHARPEVPYEQTKLAAEHAALRIGEVVGLATTILRPALVYGPHDENFLPSMVSALRDGTYRHVGNPDRPANVCAVRHIADMVGLAMAHPDKAGGQAFNVLDGELPTWRQLTRAMAAELGVPHPRLVVPCDAAHILGKLLDRVRDAGFQRGLPPLTHFRARVLGTTCVYRIDKAKEILGFTPREALLPQAPALVRAILGRPAR
jgi:nucleoside-diphosphate-sugar epimerase